MTQMTQERYLSQEFLTQIILSMHDALLVLDDQGVIQLVNPAAEQMLGYDEADLIGRPLESFLSDAFAVAKAQTQNLVTDCSLLRSDGTSVPVAFSSMLTDQNSNEKGVVCIARDISERQRRDEELRRYAAKLVESNRELTDFAYVASHDLQEPLRKVTAFGERLRSKCGDSLGEQGLGYLDRMQNAAGRMQVLINDLLSYSRVVTKAKPFAEVNLAQVAEEVMGDLEVRITELDARIKLAALPTIDADALQMRQLLQNLIGNALKFHRPQTQPEVKIEADVFSGPEGDLCRISIADNGIGFEPEYAERIFEVFQRLHGRSQYEGTGVGLAICRKIARRHGGNLKADGRPGEGATFHLTLPVAQADEESTT